MRNQRQENQQCRGMQPPTHPPAHRAFAEPQTGQICDHQDENQQRDHARFGDDFSQPLGPHDEPAYEQARDRDRHQRPPTPPRSRSRSVRSRSPAERNRRPNADAMWFTVTRAKAQKPQNTKACARPARAAGESPFACSTTSQMNWRIARPERRQLEIGRSARARGRCRAPCSNAARRSPGTPHHQRPTKPVPSTISPVMFFRPILQCSMRSPDAVSIGATRALRSEWAVHWRMKYSEATLRYRLRGCRIYCVTSVRPLTGGRPRGGWAG